MLKTLLARTLVLAGLGLSTAAAATVSVNIDTSNLNFGTFALQFQLTNGQVAQANTVTLSSFNFGGGSAAGSPTLVGGASGTLSTTVNLLDNAGFLTLFTQSFTPGSTLSFQLDTTLNFGSGAPDFFGMAILHNGTPIPTTGPSNQFIALSLQNPLNIQTFPSITDSDVPFVPAPTIGGSTVPEPSTLLSLALPLAWLVRRHLRR